MSKNEEFYSREGRIYHEGELVQREESTQLGEFPEEPKKPRKSRLWRWLGLGLVIILLVLTAGGGFGYFFLKTAPLAQADGRTNVLITGTDQVAGLSDTVIVASITHEPPSPKIALISLPRDMVVPVPGFGMNKINAAYSLGKNSPDTTGIQLLEDTVEQTFDVPIHYRMQVDFQAAKVMVNTVGGVTVEVKEDIYDPYFPTENYSGYTTYEIKAGTRHLNGTEALRYMRSRKTTSDFDRAARQQQVLAALLGKVTKKEFILNPENAQQMLRTYRKHVKTNLGDISAVKLAFLLRNIDQKDVSFHVLSSREGGLLTASTSFGYGLYPQSGDYQEIAEFIENIFQKKGNTLPD